MLTHIHIRVLKELYISFFGTPFSVLHKFALPLFKMNSLIIMNASFSVM
jgi:hypothetical protein